MDRPRADGRATTLPLRAEQGHVSMRQRVRGHAPTPGVGSWTGLDALRRVTSLPLERAIAALSDCEVRGVIVASGGHAWREHLLAVTSRGLAILRPAARGRETDGDWAIQFVRWPLVRLGELSETPAEDHGLRFDLVVRAGRRTFVALLDGPAGQRALRDFVVAVQRSVRGDVPLPDVEPASMLSH